MSHLHASPICLQLPKVDGVFLLGAPAHHAECLRFISKLPVSINGTTAIRRLLAARLSGYGEGTWECGHLFSMAFLAPPDALIVRLCQPAPVGTIGAV